MGHQEGNQETPDLLEWPNLDVQRDGQGNPSTARSVLGNAAERPRPQPAYKGSGQDGPLGQQQPDHQGKDTEALRLPEWPDSGIQGGGQGIEDLLPPAIRPVPDSKAVKGPRSHPTYNGPGQDGPSGQLQLPELPDTSAWPEHATDAFNFLIYLDLGANGMDTTKALRDWGIEWRNCVDVFLKMFKAAGFPHPVSMALQFD